MNTTQHPMTMPAAPAGALEILSTIIDPHQHVTRVDDGIHSVLGPDAAAADYDAKAAFYDAVVGSPLYNRLVWGCPVDRYRAFAREALASGTGPFLDAGCGSMLFTADAYAASTRPIVAIDRSLGMLRRARRRLAGRTGGLPANVVLLQADLRALPFVVRSFATVMSMGMLHLFDDAGAIVTALADLSDSGSLRMTSLVASGRLGDRYLALLHRSGEVAAPRTEGALAAQIVQAIGRAPSCGVEGNMAFVVA